MMRINRERFRK